MYCFHVLQGGKGREIDKIGTLSMLVQGREAVRCVCKQRGVECNENNNTTHSLSALTTFHLYLRSNVVLTVVTCLTKSELSIDYAVYQQRPGSTCFLFGGVAYTNRIKLASGEREHTAFSFVKSKQQFAFKSDDFRHQ